MSQVRCPECRGPARTEPNPYYGKGLAVHVELLICPSCGFTGYRENERVPELQPPLRHASLRDRISGLFHTSSAR